MSIGNCSSPASLKAEFEVVRRLQQKGASWDQLEQGIVRLTACSNNGGCAFATEMIAGIRSLSTPLNNAIDSERSRLSAAAIELVSSLSAGLGPAFEPLISLFFPTLLGLCARTNTVFTRRAKACIFNVIENTRSPSLLSYLTESVNHKSTSLRLVAAKGVLACLDFKPLNDTRARLIEEVIKKTSQDARVDVRKAGENILQAYKALLPDGAKSFIALPPVAKKPSAVPRTAALQLTSPVLPRGCSTSGRVRPVGSLNAKKISQSYPRSSAKLQRDISTVMPTTSSRQDTLLPSSEPSQSSAQGTNPTTQRTQRVGTTHTCPRGEEPRVGGRRRVAAPLPEAGGTQAGMARTRIRNLSVKPSLLPKPSKIPILTEAALQTASSKASEGTSVRHGKPRPSKPDLLSVQSTSQPKVVSPLVPATKPPQRAGSKVMGPHDEETGAATRRVPVRAAPHPQTDIARTRVRKTRPVSVKPAAVSGTLPKLPTSQCDPKINPIPKKVEPQTTSRTSRRRVIASQASKQVVGQKKVPVQGGRPVTTVPEPKPILNELINAIIAGINNPDTINPPRSRGCVQKPPVQIPSHMLVPQDIKLPSYMSMRCRIRRPSWQPPREDSRCGASFFTSSLRASVASPLSPLRIHGTEVIPHVHDPDISCFQGCELQEVLDRFNLDIELDHATMLYR